MGRPAILSIKIISDAKDAAAGFDKASGLTSKFAKGAKMAGGALLVTAGTAKVAYDQLVKPAGDLEQSIGGVDAVFKKNAEQVHAWAKGAASDVGLARNEYNELAVVLGSQLKNGGTAIDDLGGKTNELIGVGSDLSAMFGGTTADAVSALSSALKGERDPIERYGVSLKQASIDAEAARLGFEKVGGSLSDEASQAATLSLIMKQTKDAHGAFGRESDTLAHKQQVFAASVENVKARLGTALLPIATKVFGFLADTAVPAVEKVMGALDGLMAGGGGGDLVAQLGLDKLKPILSAVAGYFQKVAPVVKEFVTGALIPLGQTIATKVAPILQKIITTVLPVLAAAWAKLIPVVGEVVSALGPLIAAIADRLMPIISRLLPVVTTVFTAIVNVVKPVLSTLAAIIRTVTAVIKGDWSGAWAGIKSILSNAWTAIKAVITGALSIIKTVLSAAWAGIKAAAGAAWNGIKTLITGAWNGIKAGIGAAVTGVKTTISNAWTAIKSTASSAWTGVKTTISNAVESLKTAISTKVTDVVQLFKDLPGKITSAVSGFGSLLEDAGQKLLDGLISGITSKISAVKDKLTGLTNSITDWKGPLPKDKKLLTPAGLAIMDGLIKGIQANVPELRRTLTGVTNTIAGTETALASPRIEGRPRSSRGRALPPSSARTGTVINITVNGAVDPLSTAKQIEDLLARRRFAYGGTA